MDSSEIKHLLQQYLNGTISEEDFKRLWQTLQTNNQDWLIAIDEALKTNTPQGLSTENQAQQALDNIKKEKIRIPQTNIPENSEIETRDISQPDIPNIKPKIRSIPKLLKYAAAAVIILASAITLKYTTNKPTPEAPAIAATSTHDVEPGGQKAMLTLTDGSTIVLDNAGNGQIAQQGSTRVIKLATGEIQYKTINKASTETGSNTMSTPRGGQYQLQLPDGSKVWLNSESSITYPVAFTSNERKVTITGEAYFEVAKDKKKPFRVVTSDMTVEVLGTHFNVKAYSDEGPTKTSLLEGSVKIDKQILKPGQAFANGKIIPTNVEQDVAWKNGIFNFDNQNLTQVMKQLARWYDLEIVYAADIPQKEYGGEIGRNLKLAQVLKGLENSGVHFQLHGKRLTVSGKK